MLSNMGSRLLWLTIWNFDIRSKKSKIITRLTQHHLTDCEFELWWLCLLSLWAEEGTRSNVTGKFWTSCPQTSQFLFPFVVNHLIAQFSCRSLRAPLQLHSILSVFSSSQASKQILQIASSSGISSSSFCIGTGVIWSEFPIRQVA